MKHTIRRTLALLTALALIAALWMSAATAFAAGATIAEAEAKQIALQQAGVEESAVTNWIKAYVDGGEWEIEFLTSEYKYEMEIDTRSGAVRDFERKRLPTDGTAALTLDEAKIVALEHAKGQMEITGDVKYTKAKLDREHGRQIYEVEFRNRGVEFEYEIDASTGDILEWDIDRD